MHLTEQFQKRPHRSLFSNFGSPDGSGSDLGGMGSRPGFTADEKLDALVSQFAPFRADRAVFTITGWMSRMESHVTTALGGEWNRISAHSLHECAKLRPVLLLSQMFPARQDPGLHSNTIFA